MLDRGSLGLIESAQGLYTAALIDGFICTELGVDPLRKDPSADKMGRRLVFGCRKARDNIDKTGGLRKGTILRGMQESF